MKTQLIPAVNFHDHILGNSKAVIELVEYGDYQCPYCGQAYPIIKNLQHRFGADLTFVFRNFPLSTIHPHAILAAISTEAAAMQGKFWEMHDIIFENQRRIHKTALTEYAHLIGLDLKQFEIDQHNDSLIEKVKSDFESGLRSGVNGTPSFFINGDKYNGDWDENTFNQYLKNHLSQSKAL